MVTVLLVDDSKTARMMLAHWIRAIRPDFRILEAGTGEEALATLSQTKEPIHSVFVDYNMPGMNGLELVVELKAFVALKYIALCTANLQEVIRQRTEQMGIVYMAKPLSPAKVKIIFEGMDL